MWCRFRSAIRAAKSVPPQADATTSLCRLPIDRAAYSQDVVGNLTCDYELSAHGSSNPGHCDAPWSGLARYRGTPEGRRGQKRGISAKSSSRSATGRDWSAATLWMTAIGRRPDHHDPVFSGRKDRRFEIGWTRPDRSGPPTDLLSLVDQHCEVKKSSLVSEPAH
jgi:hypothetical protein